MVYYIKLLIAVPANLIQMTIIIQLHGKEHQRAVKMAQVLGTLSPMGNQSSRLLNSAWTSPGYCGLLESDLVVRSLYHSLLHLSLSLSSPCHSFKEIKSIIFMKNNKRFVERKIAMVRRKIARVRSDLKKGI